MFEARLYNFVHRKSGIKYVHAVRIVVHAIMRAFHIHVFYGEGQKNASDMHLMHVFH